MHPPAAGLLQSPLLAGSPGLRHGLTTRSFGPVGGRALPGALEARSRLVRALGADPRRLVVPHQVHEAAVAVVGEADAGGEAVPATDGLATATPGVSLLVQGADCPLVALHDARAGVVAAVHSGWRGTVKHIVARGVEAVAGLGGRPGRVLAGVFPGIGPCCFEVGGDVVEAMRDAFGAPLDAWLRRDGARPGRWMLDLSAAIVHTLEGAGVARDRIDVVPGCTACGGQLWSHRASGGGPERHGLAVALAE